MSPVTIADLLHLSLAERLQLVEDLWDSIAAETVESPSKLPVTGGQRRDPEEWKGHISRP